MTPSKALEIKYKRRFTSMGKIYKLSRINIEGIWRKYPPVNCDLKLKKNTSIFVGKNGSGKTTVLRIIKAFLSGNYNELYNCPPFGSIMLEFKHSPNSKSVEISGEFTEEKFVYTYDNNKEFEIDEKFILLHSSSPRFGRHKLSEEKQAEYESFKSYINKLVTFESITIDRDHPSIDEREFNDYSIARRRARLEDSDLERIDNTLSKCIAQVSDFHKKNILEINKITNDFFKDTFSKLLIPDEEKLRRIKFKSQIISGKYYQDLNGDGLDIEVDSYNKVLSDARAQVGCAAEIVETFLALHNNNTSNFKAPAQSKGFGPKQHTIWCNINEFYGELSKQMSALMKFRPAKISSKIKTILHVEETTTLLIECLQKCDICYGESKVYFSEYFNHEAVEKLGNLDFLYKGLFELKHYCMKLIDVINANGTVATESNQNSLLDKITAEIEENKELLRGLLSQTDNDHSQIEKMVKDHNLQVENLLNESTQNNSTYALTRLYIHDRITEILQDYKKLTHRTTDIEESILNMCELISEFIQPKYIGELDGNLSIYHDDIEIDFKVLSSGEKQLLILLIKVFLAGNSLVTLDEPELSLHIGWQQKLLDAMHRLNPNAQLIVATHSPEIAAFNKAEIVSFER